MRQLIVRIWETLVGSVATEKDDLDYCRKLLLHRKDEINKLKDDIELLKFANSVLSNKLDEKTERCELLQRHIDEVYEQGGYYFDALKDVKNGIGKIYDSIVRYENKKFGIDDATPPTSTN